jgi:hypothetical protein
MRRGLVLVRFPVRERHRGTRKSRDEGKHRGEQPERRGDAHQVVNLIDRGILATFEDRCPAKRRRIVAFERRGEGARVARRREEEATDVLRMCHT